MIRLMALSFIGEKTELSAWDKGLNFFLFFDTLSDADPNMVDRFPIAVLFQLFAVVFSILIIYRLFIKFTIGSSIHLYEGLFSRIEIQPYENSESKLLSIHGNIVGFIAWVSEVLRFTERSFEINITQRFITLVRAKSFSIFPVNNIHSFAISIKKNSLFLLLGSNCFFLTILGFMYRPKSTFTVNGRLVSEVQFPISIVVYGTLLLSVWFISLYFKSRIFEAKITLLKPDLEREIVGIRVQSLSFSEQDLNAVKTTLQQVTQQESNFYQSHL